MSMKGGAAGPKKLIVETDEFFDPAAAAAGAPGQFSPSRYIGTLLHSQDPVMIEKVAREFESLLSSLSETDIKNLYRKFTAELQNPEQGLITLLGAYPQETGAVALDLEASEAEIELMTALTVMDEYEPAMESRKPGEIRTAFKALLDHAVPALYHFQKADKAFQEILTPDHTAAPPALPPFIAAINPDFARQVQEDLNLRPAHEIDVTQIINTALAGTSRETQKFGQIELLIPPLLSIPTAFETKRQTRRDFEKKLDAFRDGALGGLDDVKDLIAKTDDPALKQEFEIRLKDSAHQRLEEHRTAQISLTPDEVSTLERTVQNPVLSPEPSPSPAPAPENPSSAPLPLQTAPLAIHSLNDVSPVPLKEPAVIIAPALPEPRPGPAPDLSSSAPAQKPEAAVSPVPFPVPKETPPSPAPPTDDTWLQDLQSQVERNSRKAFELYDRIKDGPGSPSKEPAQNAAKDLASTYTSVQRALQDYQSEKTPVQFETLTAALEKLAELQTSGPKEVMLRYDRDAAIIEDEYRKKLEEQQQIAFQMEQFSPKPAEQGAETSSTPAITAPSLFGGGGGFGS